MRHFYMDNLSGGYPYLIEEVLQQRDLPSRLGTMREVNNLVLELRQPRFCVIGREAMNTDFMEAEILQLYAGEYDKELLAASVPRAAELITLETAYGPRTARQVRWVTHELTNSPDTRRAVVYVGRPDDLEGTHNPEINEKRAGEMPCTSLWQFFLRDNALHMTVFMRSWDLVWGLSYDVPSFVAIQAMIARHLGVELGSYIHHAGSGHIYDKHYGIDTWTPELEDADLYAYINPLLEDYVGETQKAAREKMEALRQQYGVTA